MKEVRERPIFLLNLPIGHHRALGGFFKMKLLKTNVRRDIQLTYTIENIQRRKKNPNYSTITRFWVLIEK